MARFFSLFKKIKGRASVVEQVVRMTPLEDELNQLTDQALANSEKKLWESYRHLIAKYNADKNPLGEEQAKRILEQLIREAVTNRRMLNTGIERSISEGGLYQRYYNKIAIINDMTNDTYIKMRRMQDVQDRYAQKKQVYNNVTGQMYIEGMVRAVKEDAAVDVPVDIGEAIDKVGDALDEKETI